MTSRLQKSGGAGARAIAVFCAALILVSQAIGAAHFHRGAASRDGVPVAQLTVDEGFCPICQLALHSPGSVSSAPAVVRGPAIAETIFFAAPIRSESPVFSAARVRAPPVSL
jgi:hypothetical protein